MRRSDFHYHLPGSQIAQYPPECRGDSRLLYMGAGDAPPDDKSFKDLDRLLQPGDLLVFNDTRVIPARLFGRKASGGRVEILLERMLDDRRMQAQLRASKPTKPGTMIQLDNGAQLRVTGREGDFYLLELQSPGDTAALLERAGHMPLPPYIKRPDEAGDRERYQTVYACRPGAVAAPTAGLHFTHALLDRLRERGVVTATLTLHVGAGTFQPVRTETLEEHVMHSEWYEVPEKLALAVNLARKEGRRVVAVGTTTVRCLEAAARDGVLPPSSGETELFIYPGYRFRMVDALITNFHLPESSLLMLVCAFAGRDRVLQAYAHAVSQGYRFYSYGDAMLISGQPATDH